MIEQHTFLKYFRLYRLRQISLLALLLTCSFAAQGQSKKELEKKRKAIKSEIQAINRELIRTSKNRQAKYDHIVALQSQVRRREELIQTISQEVRELDDLVTRNTNVIASLTRDISDRQKEYGRLMRGALRFKMLTHPILFVLSAKSINEAYRRWVFLRKYDRYRSQQAEAIQFTRSMLTRKTLQIEESRLEKNQLLTEESENKLAITREVAEQNKSLAELKTDEERLRSDLEERKKAAIALEQAIEEIIREEVRRAAEARAARERRARERAERAKSEKTEPAETAKARKRREEREAESDQKISADDATSRAFLEQKGKLNWPVASGFIARQFGNVSHSVYKEIKIQNNGIDIRTDVDATVSAVYGGNVVGVTFVPGHDYTVIVQHGSFYTVYANLASTTVSKGDKITEGQRLGRVSMNPISGASELHFEIWMHKEHLDPERWIARGPG